MRTKRYSEIDLLKSLKPLPFTPFFFPWPFLPAIEVTVTNMQSSKKQKAFEKNQTCSFPCQSSFHILYYKDFEVS
jgi:hypothetical protein